MCAFCQPDTLINLARILPTDWMMLDGPDEKKSESVSCLRYSVGHNRFPDTEAG